MRSCVCSIAHSTATRFITAKTERAHPALAAGNCTISLFTPASLRLKNSVASASFTHAADGKTWQFKEFLLWENQPLK